MQKNIRRYWPIFLLPTLAAFLIGFVIPFIQGLYLSLCKFTTINKTTFVGLSNYVKAFQDEQFAHAFGFTASFTVVSTVLINVIALGIALLLTRGIKGTTPFRTVFFMPNLIGGIVLGYIWSMIFDGILVKYDTSVVLESKYGMTLAELSSYKGGNVYGRNAAQ